MRGGSVFWFLSFVLFCGGAVGVPTDLLQKDLSILQKDLAGIEGNQEKQSFLAVENGRRCGGVKEEVAELVATNKKSMGLKASDTVTMFFASPRASRTFTALLKDCSASDQQAILAAYPWRTREAVQLACAALPGSSALQCPPRGLCTDALAAAIKDTKVSDQQNFKKFFLHHIVMMDNGMDEFLASSDPAARSTALALLSTNGQGFPADKVKAAVDRLTKSMAPARDPVAQRYAATKGRDLSERILDDCAAPDDGTRLRKLSTWLGQFEAVASAEKDPSGARALAIFQWAMRAAFRKRQQQSYGNAWVFPCSEYSWAEAMARRNGPGSAYVKTWLITAFYARNPRNAGPLALELLSTDPSGVLAELTGNSILEPGLVNQIFKDIVTSSKYRVDAKVKDIAGILGGAMSALVMTVADANWLTLATQMKFHSAAHDLGVGAGALANAISNSADMKKQLIEEGKMILNIFTKAVTKLVPVVGEAIGSKVSDKINSMEAEEKGEVDQWEARLKRGVSEMLDVAFHAASKGKTRGEFHDIAVQFQVYYNDGYEKAIRNKLESPRSTMLAALKFVDGHIDLLDKVAKYVPPGNPNEKMNTAEENEAARKINDEAKKLVSENVMKVGGHRSVSEEAKRIAKRQGFEGNLNEK